MPKYTKQRLAQEKSMDKAEFRQQMGDGVHHLSHNSFSLLLSF